MTVRAVSAAKVPRDRPALTCPDLPPKKPGHLFGEFVLVTFSARGETAVPHVSCFFSGLADAPSYRGNSRGAGQREYPFKAPFWKVEPKHMRIGNPECLQARAVGLIKRLKVNLYHVTEYGTFDEVVTDWPSFIDKVYNAATQHSALGYPSRNHIKNTNVAPRSKIAVRLIPPGGRTPRRGPFRPGRPSIDVEGKPILKVVNPLEGDRDRHGLATDKRHHRDPQPS